MATESNKLELELNSRFFYPTKTPLAIVVSGVHLDQDNPRLAEERNKWCCFLEVHLDQDNPRLAEERNNFASSMICMGNRLKAMLASEEGDRNENLDDTTDSNQSIITLTVFFSTGLASIKLSSLAVALLGALGHVALPVGPRLERVWSKLEENVSWQLRQHSFSHFTISGMTFIT